MRDTGIADRLRDAGLVVEEQPGWQTRGSALFAPRAVMWHHTASAMGRNLPSLNIVTNGRPDLTGPLCHVLTGRDNCNVVIAAGRANHAGAGSWNGSSVGNSAYWGVEVENVGTTAEPWRPDQLQNVAEVTAALIGYNAALVADCCMHKEWAPRRKIDMHSVSGNEMRARVMQLCNGTPPEPTPPAPPPAPGVDLAAIAAGIAAASKQIVKQGSKGDAAKWAQILLNSKLDGPDLKVDGVFGPASVAAAKRFQTNVKRFFKLSSKQMPVDGIIGPATWFWLTK